MSDSPEIIKSEGSDGSVIELHPTFYQGQTTFNKISRSKESFLGKERIHSKRSYSLQGKDFFKHKWKKMPEKPKLAEPVAVKGAYDKARTNESKHFKELLRELLFLVVKEDSFVSLGRSGFSKQDRLFIILMKTYYRSDLRKTSSILKELRDSHYISKSPSYKSISNFFNDESLSKILDDLILISALPLANLETTGAIDATGFSTSQFASWNDFKWGQKEGKHRNWVKLHAFTGCKTNCFISGEITLKNVADVKMTKDVIRDIPKKFNMTTFVADKAYLSREVMTFMNDLGMRPYINFKKNSVGTARGTSIWKELFNEFIYDNESYMEIYHQRSNVETNFSMLKERFGKHCSSKLFIGQTNEIKCKMLAVNLCLLIQAAYEFNISLDLSSCVKTDESV